MHLSPDDVQDIVQLLDSLAYDEFEVQTGSLRVVLRRADGWTQESWVLDQPKLMATDVAEPAADRAAHRPVADDSIPPGLVGIRAPLPGTFYRAPKPGAPPYVDVGGRVEEDTVVGLVETMKLFNSVYANVRGVVVEFRVDNAAFADQDAVLVLVRPDEA